MIATGDLVKASQVYELYVQTYPRDARALSNLGYTDWYWDATRKHWRSIARELRLDPDNVRNYTNVAGCLINMNRFDEAESVLQQAQQRKLDESCSGSISTASLSTKVTRKRCIAWCGARRSGPD